MDVVGLDLSTKRIGYAAADGELLSISGHAGPADPYRRLSELARALARTLALRPPLPDLAVIEDYAFGPYPLAAARLGEIGGVIRTRLFELDVRMVLVPPASLKRFATGRGNADKDAMVHAVTVTGAHPANHDEADAFHLRRMGRAAHGLEGPLADYQLAAIAHAGVAW